MSQIDIIPKVFLTNATVADPALGILADGTCGNDTVRNMMDIGSMQQNMKIAPKIRGFFRPTQAAMKITNIEHAMSFTAPKMAVNNRSRCPSPTSS